MKNALSKLGKEKLPQFCNEPLPKKPTDNIMLHAEKLEIFSLKSRTQEEYLLSALFFNIILKVSANIK